MDWLNNFIFGQTAYGLEIIIQQNNSLVFKLIKSTLHKSNLELVEKIEGDTLNELLEYSWVKKIPLYLTISGKGVIQKRILKDENSDEVNLIQKVLPNAKLSDFYFQAYAVNDKEVLLSLIRKNILDNILSNLRDRKLHILGIELGLLALGKLKGILEIDRFNLHQDTVHLKDGIAEFESDNGLNYPDRVKIGEESIETRWLPAFSTSLDYFKIKLEKKDNFSIEQDKAEFRQHALFLFGVRFSLAFFLLLLLLNFLVLQSYNNKYSVLSNKLELNGSIVKELKKLKMEYDQNQLFLKSTGLVASSKNSFYADKLASTLPEGIYWNQLILNPSKKTIKNSEDIDFQIGTIYLSGVTNKSEFLSKWIEVIEDETWIKSIDIKDYEKLENNKGGSFYIQIQLNEL